jgi:hypothetical protein
MKRGFFYSIFGTTLILVLGVTACIREPKQATNNTNVEEMAPPTVGANELAVPLTIPVVDALFHSDEGFSKALKEKLNLNDDQIQKLKTMAREETGKLYETGPDEYKGSTSTARELAAQKVKEIIGEEKLSEFGSLVRERWGGGIDADGSDINLTGEPNSVPTDSRIVVNSPAYRMDVFEKGKLIKTYKIGIGYPEFPIPTGLRKADTIIFNPSWVPPDEPWVESSTKVKPGETVPPGSKLNPLGMAKIPIGPPSLIHGGKPAQKLGTFASHGCVGLTDSQVQDFAKILARLGNATLTDAQIRAYTKDKTKTQNVKLDTPVQVELRYEPVVVQDGKVHIYRDVYDREPNLRNTLEIVLDIHGVSLDKLTEAERTQLLEGVNKISEKKEKEVIVEVAALKGKGYPAPVALNTGGAKK